MTTTNDIIFGQLQRVSELANVLNEKLEKKQEQKKKQTQKTLADILIEKMVKDAKNKEEDMTLPQELNNIKINIVRNRKADGRHGCGNGYRVTLQNLQTGYKFSTTYNDSIVNSRANKKVNLNDVIYSLLMAKADFESCRDYQDFCNMFGYDLYERKGQRAWQGCRFISENLDLLLTSETIEKLQEIYQDY